MSLRRLHLAMSTVFVLLELLCVLARSAAAEPLEWRLEQPSPPAHVAGEAAHTPIGLGRIGDIEFWAPNRGLLITDGNPPTIPAGLWAYNGEGWHELATVCGATDGRIAWAGPDEFWTISDGRPGQAANPENGEPAPLQDNTLCHFSDGEVVGSYASLAFEPSSYRPMHAAACTGSADCWFGGDALPSPQTGAFHLHWDGSAVGAQPGPQGHAVEDLRAFEGRLFESVRLDEGDLLSEEESAEHPSILHEISPSGAFTSLLPRSPESHAIVPQYGNEEFPEALDALHLSAAGETLWGAAGPVDEPPSGSNPAAVTVLRYEEDPETGQLGGTEVIGPGTSPSGEELFGKELVNSIAAEPGTEGAWLALDTRADSEHPTPAAHAQVASVSSEGTTVSESLPSTAEAEEGVGPKGGAQKIVCPAQDDCWMVTTQGWLYHLSDGEALPRDTDPAFAGLITVRPPDEGVPQVPPDTPPVDDSGLLGEIPTVGAIPEEKKQAAESRVAVPLISKIHSRLVHQTTLELRFHLAVKAQVRLVAKRHGKRVAASSKQTLSAGNHRILLRLDPRHWPTALKLEQHALAPLPTVVVHSEGGIGSSTVSTVFGVLPHAALGSDQRP